MRVIFQGGAGPANGSFFGPDFLCWLNKAEHIDVSILRRVRAILAGVSLTIKFMRAHSITDAHQVPTEINVKFHLLIRFEPRAIATAEYLQWGHRTATEVPTVYLIAPPKRGIQHV